ncbi:tRNA nucleotidyltransferase cca2 isoform X1 [Solanum verrucosum]|uniref:tRNA nucleotidyltransferase cca2 isoform X1 n=1 Tax=Solanum verrucosum TaxID=315347 RepID=UPI0020D1BA0F|nr:tRNA nucleotidyltransferase cca2 isoform X1 [Solanum verrucosum]
MKALSIAVAAFSTFNTTRPRLFTFPNPSTSSSLLLPAFKLKRFSIFSVQQSPPALGFYAGVTTMGEGSAFQPLSVQVKDHIDLTPKEEQIFNRLLQVVEHYNMGTQLRVAGGWVRDKLLGKECYDIDIALDNMYGREFCEKVNEYLSASGEETQGVGVIQCNPDQSKHLETARMRLFDVWIDFVNLRAEDYSQNSRIPTMKFGTAKQDADRRDLTINSLFYNINNRSVEDLTERGIADLKSGKIVTPLPPKQTFLDDPLRVLRAIRFGARFGFILDEELKKAAADEDVRVAIADKISRERIGHEIDLMMSGDQPVKAMTYIADLKLFSAVFSLPSDFEPSIPDGCDRLCVTCLGSAWELLSLIGRSSFSDDQRRLCLYAALFLPFRETIYRDNKAKKIPVVNYIFRNSLKLKASDAETVISLHTVTKKFVSLIPLLVSKEDIQVLEVDWKRDTIEVPIASKLRILTGLLLREIKEFWRVTLLLSMQLHPVDIVSSTSFSNENFELDKSSGLFKSVENAVRTLGLDKVWEMKPLVNGKEIMNILQIKSGGPVVREWQQKLLEWQLAHPSGSAEECIDWMKQAQSKHARTE